WIIDEEDLATRSEDFVNDAWRRGDDVHVVLAPESFLNDLHVEQTEEAAPKTEAESDGTFRLIHERGIVQAQLSDRGFQMLEIGGVNRVNAAEYHRMDLLEPRQRLSGGMACVRDGVADL